MDERDTDPDHDRDHDADDDAATPATLDAAALERAAVEYLARYAASRRGVARTAAFAPAKAAQRSLVESMARHLWPQRVHVALIIVDGVVDLPKARAYMRDKPDEFFIQPDAVAETAYRLTTQPESAWSFEVEARPFGEVW